MTTTTLDVRVRAYLEDVKSQLADLAEAERDDLVEDLEQHLLEVAAEFDGDLEDRLGPADVYAEELRSSAGLASRAKASSRSVTDRIADRLARSSAMGIVTELASNSGYRAARDFVRELRPGWWVARGYVAVLAPAIFTVEGPARTHIPFPFLAGSRVIGLCIVAVAVLASVALGIRTRRDGSYRRTSIGFTILVLAAGFASMVKLSDTMTYPSISYDQPAPVSQLQHSDGVAIVNLCPYAPDGKLLSGVLLFDQDGRPVTDAASISSDGIQYLRAQPAIGNAYPLELEKVDSESGEHRPAPCPVGLVQTQAGPASSPR